MPFETEAAKLSRRPFTFVRLDFDNPLSAQGFEYHCTDLPPHGQQMFPSIENRSGIDPAPTRMDIASGLGYRGNVRITFKDFIYGERGTYWGKLLAANPYYLDRPITIYEGFYDRGPFNISDFKQKLYFIKKISGPDSNGVVVLTAASILTMLDNDQAKTPNKSAGSLVSSITASSTGITDIGDNTGFDPAGGICVVNSEYIRYSGTSGVDSIVIDSGADRGVFGTTADDHSAGDSVFHCFSFENENVVDVIRRLIDEQSPIDASTYINDTDWNAVRDDYLPGQIMTGVVTPTEDTKDVIDKLCEQGYVSVWWSEEDQEIKLEAIGPVISPTTTLNKISHILGEGEKPERDPTKAISAVLVFYGIRNPEEDHEDPKNYQYSYFKPDAEAVAGNGTKIKTIYADYIPGSGLSSATRIAARTLSQYAQGLFTYTFQVDAKDSLLKVGQRANIDTDKIQDSEGFNELSSFIIIERDRQREPSRYQYKAIKTGFLIEAGYRKIAPDSMSAVTYATATDEQRAEYAFIADDTTNEMSNGDPPTLIL